MTPTTKRDAEPTNPASHSQTSIRVFRRGPSTVLDHVDGKNDPPFAKHLAWADSRTTGEPLDAAGSLGEAYREVRERALRIPDDSHVRWPRDGEVGP